MLITTVWMRICALSMALITALGCARGDLDISLECLSDANEPPRVRVLRYRIENRGDVAVVLEGTQLAPEVSAEVFSCDGVPMPRRLSSFPLPAEERPYVTLRPREEWVQEFRIADVTLTEATCYKVQVRYHPSAYEEAPAHGVIRAEIVSNTLVVH